MAIENRRNSPITIPTTYFEILEFINENRQEILENWKLLFEILNKLDVLLKNASTMSDLHKDTKIILETIKLQQDTLLKEIRNELTLESLVQLSESTFLEDFFLSVKTDSQTIKFLDQLDFTYTAKQSGQKRERIKHEDPVGNINLPDVLREIDAGAETNVLLQDIKNKVAKKGKIEFFEMIIDSESYSKTVLNAFNLTLAIRMKLVSLKMIDGVLFTTLHDSSNQNLDHSVLEITPEMYEKIKNNFKKLQK